MLTSLLAGAGALLALLGLLTLLARRVSAPKLRRAAGWLLALSALALGLLGSLAWPFWGRMLAVWVCAFVAFKALALLAAPFALTRQIRLAWLLAWLVGWLGMELEPWAGPRQPNWPQARRWLGQGALLVGAGLLLSGLAWLPPLRALPVLPRASVIWVGWVVAVFFGCTRLLTAFWHGVGRPVELLFDQPVYARSLAEWWGRRWNRAVHTVLDGLIWRPLYADGPLRAWGDRGALLGLLAVFSASGALHELLLSYPARGGWGGPTSYFLLQMAGMALERRWRISRRWRPAWVLSMTLLPAPLLFHGPFVQAMAGWLL